MRTIDVLQGVCQALGASPDQLFRRAGTLPAEEERDEVGFWDLLGIIKWLTHRRAQDSAAEGRKDVIEYALSGESRRG